MPAPSQIVNGVPVNSDVQALLDAFPSLDKERGRIITHEEVEGVLNIERGTNRYRTVTEAWRTRLLPELAVESERSVGFRVLHEHDRVLSGIKTVKRGVRQVKRGASKVAMARSELMSADQAEEHRRALERTSSLSAMLDREAKAVRVIAPSNAGDMPRLSLPSEQRKKASDGTG